VLQKQNTQLLNEVKLQQEENRKLEDRFAALEALLSAQTPKLRGRRTQAS
jgi:hypothetical protein